MCVCVCGCIHTQFFPCKTCRTQNQDWAGLIDMYVLTLLKPIVSRFTSNLCKRVLKRNRVKVAKRMLY